MSPLNLRLMQAAKAQPVKASAPEERAQDTSPAADSKGSRQGQLSATAGRDVTAVIRNMLREETSRKAAIAAVEILGEPVGKRRRAKRRR